MTYASMQLEKLEQSAAGLSAKGGRAALENCAEFRGGHGNRSFDTAMGLLSKYDLTEPDSNALADGYVLILGIFGFAKQTQAKNHI